MTLGPEDQALRERLHAVPSETQGNVAAAARKLHKAPMQVRRWCRRLAIDLATYRS
jgi:transcriptional regulator with GAF, ATPase, and Fis domain